MPVQEIFYPALAAVGGPVKNIFPHSTLFELICPQGAVKIESRPFPAIYECGVMTGGCVLLLYNRNLGR